MAAVLPATGASPALTQRDRYPFDSRHLSVGGQNIFCVEAGTGDPILFSQGKPTSSYGWREVMPAVAKAAGRRCIAIDLLWHPLNVVLGSLPSVSPIGTSRRPPTGTPISGST